MNKNSTTGKNNLQVVSSIVGTLDNASESMDIGPDGVYEITCDLLKNKSVILAATNPETNTELGEALTKDEILSQLILTDDAEGLGRLVQDKVIQYVMMLARQRIAAQN